MGIILTQDGQNSVSASWKPGAVSGSVRIPDTARRIEIKADGGSLRIAGDVEATTDSLTLTTSDDVYELHPHDGIELWPVATGRGFHWQNRISVSLPGQLSFRASEGRLEVINTIDIESYVACVATSEMGAAAPSVLLEAQTIVARCWAMALIEKKHIDEGFDVCNDDCCQRYQGTTYVSPPSIDAARNTAGKVLVHRDTVIDARYSKNCGGIVEDYTAAWGGEPVPYLIPLWDAPTSQGRAHYGSFAELFEFKDAFCAPARFKDVDLTTMLGKVDVSGSYYRWSHDVSIDTLLTNLRKYHETDWESIESIDVKQRGASGRIVVLEVSGRDEAGSLSVRSVDSEYAIRRLFSDSFLYSSAFEIQNIESFCEDGVVRMIGCGWGHGVGLCQMGALGMSLSGYTVDEILDHYYPATELREYRGRNSGDHS